MVQLEFTQLRFDVLGEDTALAQYAMAATSSAVEGSSIRLHRFALLNFRLKNRGDIANVFFVTIE